MFCSDQPSDEERGSKWPFFLLKFDLVDQGLWPVRKGSHSTPASAVSYCNCGWPLVCQTWTLCNYCPFVWKPGPASSALWLFNPLYRSTSLVAVVLPPDNSFDKWRCNTITRVGSIDIDRAWLPRVLSAKRHRPYSLSCHIFGAQGSGKAFDPT